MAVLATEIKELPMLVIYKIHARHTMGHRQQDNLKQLSVVHAPLAVPMFVNQRQLLHELADKQHLPHLVQQVTHLLNQQQEQPRPLLLVLCLPLHAVVMFLTVIVQ